MFASRLVLWPFGSSGTRQVRCKVLAYDEFAVWQKVTTESSCTVPITAFAL
jgi:hypothetical protein